MKLSLRSGFRQQVILTFTLGILCLSLVSSFFISSISSRSVHNQLLGQGKVITKTLAERSTLALLYQSAETAGEAADAILGFPDIVGVTIYDVNNHSLYTNGESMMSPDENKSWPLESLIYQESPESWFFMSPVFTASGGMKEEDSPFMDDVTKPELIGYVHVVMTKDTLNNMTGSILHTNLLVSTGLASIILLLLCTITSRLTRPLRDLADLMRCADQGDKQVRAKLKGPADIIYMEQAFNAMMGELESRENELKGARDRALEAARAKAQFAAMVSHELRTPMNSVMGMIQLLQTSTLDVRQAEFARVAHNSSRSLLVLIDDLLDFSKIESGKMQINPVDFNVHDLLGDIVKLLSTQAEKKGLLLSQHLPTNIPDYLKGDDSRIRQVLINLVGNAIKFTSKGSVTIQVDLDNELGQPMLKFAIKDTGIGIPQEAQKRIFEAFSQMDASTTRKFGGTGLGLSISIQLVDLMGGAMHVSSKPGAGSTFYFTLPLIEGDSAALITEISPSESVDVKCLDVSLPIKPLVSLPQEFSLVATGNDQLITEDESDHSDQLHHILIVDDDPGARFTLHSSLENSGYRLSEAENGYQALQLCKQRMPDLILMDGMMPEMDGFTACKEIKKLTKARSPAIVMVTALHDENSIDRSFVAGAEDFITKPVNLVVLRNRVKHLLQSKRSEKYIHRLAYYDNLTDLPNRSFFKARAVEMIQMAKRHDCQMALMFLDLDRFKLINDTMGHHIGDLLLKTVAQRIQGCLRSTDFIARLGGDEFTVVLGGVESKDDVTRIAEKICETFTHPLSLVNEKIHMSTSIGIAVYPGDGADVDTLMRRADTAMYQGKNQGGSCFNYFEHNMETEILRKTTLEKELHRALKNNEFVLHYQPQANLKTGQLVGVEALVRWNHPERGVLPPAEFIDLAEETGLIRDIGDWVIEAACKQCQYWRSQNIVDCPVSINLSSQQLESGTLPEKITFLLETYNLSPASLKLEITENTLVETRDINVDQLHKIKALGIGLEIDDFGTGYSSLSYLKRFPVDTLKIDRSFIKSIPSDKGDLALVSSMITLAHNLNLKVVAEGVESEEQKVFLAQNNCDVMQGYLLSRPLGAALLEDWVSGYLFSDVLRQECSRG